uniref:Gag-pol polyprotein n=1 Tax=Solanum tuberosum TaxID=4113 RepID=M1DMA9_SOLTU
MNTRRANARRVEEENVNQGAPQALAAQANRDVVTYVNPNMNFVASTLRDLERMNPPEFLGSKVGNDPQEFVEEIYKIFDAMGVTSVEKVELSMADQRDMMSRYLTGVSKVVRKECCMAMRLYDMNISRFMLYAQQMEDEKRQGNNREVKRPRVGDGNFSNAKFDGQGRKRFKQSFSNQGSSSASRVDKGRVSRPNPQGDNSSGSYVARPYCAKYGRKH